MPFSGSTSRIASRNDICGCSTWIASAAFALVAAMCGEPLRILARLHRLGELRRGVGAIGDDADVDLEPPHLDRVDVDAGDLEARRHVRPAPHRRVETGAEADQQVGLRPQRIAGGHRQRRADGGRRACRGRCGYDSTGAPIFSASALISADACARAAADPDHRRLRLGDHLGQRGDLLRVGLRRRLQRQRVLRRHLGLRRELVPWHLERDRSRPARQHLLEGAGDQVRRLRSDARCDRPISPCCAASRAGPASRAAGRAPGRCRWLGTWPVRHSTGALSPQAVTSAAAVFITPGPGTTV